jgi:hypothetical protein
VGIAAGPDGNLWFAMGYVSKVGKITTAGVITEYPIASGGTAEFISSGPDGNVWFTEASFDKIGKITPAGVITEYSMPPGSFPEGITTGPDGNVWLTEHFGNKIVKVTLAPLFSTCLLYDPNKAAKSGSTVAIKLHLCGGGNNLSSSSIIVHAVSITQTSSSTSGPVEDSGNANPDNDFRFDPTLNGGGYIFNLSTKGLATGSYILNFTVSGDPTVYSVPFQVRP